MRFPRLPAAASVRYQANVSTWRRTALSIAAPSAALRSPFQRNATTGPLAIDLPKIGTVDELQSDSRQVTIKPGQPLVVKLSGQGCAALVSFLKP